MNFWGSTDEEAAELKQDKTRLEGEIKELRKEARQAKEDLTELKHKKKIEDEDIKHMVKISKEKQELEFKKKVMEVGAEKETAIGEVKDKYRDKLEERLQTEVDNMKEMYGQILERLPNVTARLRGEV